jgi:hypothetical protein
MGYLSIDFVSKWLSYLSALHPLTIILKCFLNIRKLNTYFTGFTLNFFLKKKTTKNDIYIYLYRRY